MHKTPGQVAKAGLAEEEGPEMPSEGEKASLSTPRERPERVGALKLSVAEARGRSPPAHGGEGSRMDAQLKRHYTSRGSQQTLQTVTAVPAQRRAALPRRQQLGALTDPPHSRNQREM